MAKWRQLAVAIPGESLRRDALHALDHKRASIDGGALFWTLPQRRNKSLLRLLVAYEIIADYLDCVSERSASAGIDNGLCLHRALCDALAPGAPIADYYRCNPSKDDGGYLDLLVITCQQMCVALPSFDVVRPFVNRAVNLTEVLAMNHEPTQTSRDAALHVWSERQFPERPELAWFEWCASASAWLTIFALLALAANPECAMTEAERVFNAYMPWISLVGTMLDSYVDIPEDNAVDAHSYIAHYPDQRIATTRVTDVLCRSLREISGLRDGHRHLVIFGCMVAMFLSKDSARTSITRGNTREIARAGGALTQMLVPILRTWRTAYGKRAE